MTTRQTISSIIGDWRGADAGDADARETCLDRLEAMCVPAGVTKETAPAAAHDGPEIDGPALVTAEGIIGQPTPLSVPVVVTGPLSEQAA